MGYLFSDSQRRLNKANRMLEEALVETRSAKDEIMKLYEQTRELDKLKSNFFANVSHELRTPLTLILGPIHAIAENNELPENLRQRLEVVERNARFLYRHVSDLLDVAKLEAQKMILQYSETDLAHLARVIASQFEVLAQSRNISFSTQVPETIFAHADAEKVQRILLNLLSNAFKFTPDGGEIQLVVKVVDNQAVLSIEDNGIGIATDMREIIFERFRQIDGDATRTQGGTGLGLAIVKEFTELHGGTVAVGESSGGGALFVIRLPLKAPEGTAIISKPTMLDKEISTQAIEELRMAGEQSKNQISMVSNRPDAPLILVVEDNPDMSKYLVSLLSGHYHIATAFNGKDGLLKAQELQPDLILSDIMMPRMSGDKMVMELRGHPDTADIPILLLTAKLDDNLRLLMLKTGVKDYIVKPFSNEEIVIRVDRLASEQLKHRNRQAQLDAIVEASEDAIIVLSKEGIVISWNHEAQRILGYSSDEKIGTPIIDIFSSDQRKEYKQALSRIASGKIITHFETAFNTVDRRNILVSVFIFPVYDFRKRIIGTSIILRDITEKVKLQQRYETILSTSTDGFLIVDIEGKIIQINEAYCNMTGYTQQELLQMRVNDIDALESSDETKRRIIKIKETGGDRFETKQKCKDGNVIDVEVSVNFIKSDNIMFSFIRDITQRKQIEDEIKAVNFNLQKRIEEEVAKSRTKDRLMFEQSRQVSMSELLVNISHHWRQPLCAIGVSIQDIKDAYLHGELDEAYAAENVKNAMTELLKLSQTIDNFRSFYIHEKEQKEFNIADEINKAEMLISGYIKDRGIAIVKELDESLMMHGYPNEFAHVILNILTNATDKFEEKNITSGIIKIKLNKNATGRVILSISDNGGEIPEYIMYKLFQPYFTTKDKSQRTGMGLYMAKMIIEKNMKGAIIARNIDHGCEFRIEM